jgi:hypothetical protein
VRSKFRLRQSPEVDAIYFDGKNGEDIREFLGFCRRGTAAVSAFPICKGYTTAPRTSLSTDSDLWIEPWETPTFVLEPHYWLLHIERGGKHLFWHLDDLTFHAAYEGVGLRCRLRSDGRRC